MITTVTLNPCIDRTLFVSSFQVGETNRVSNTRHVYAGKGFNVSKGIANLGHQTTATGFLYSEDSEKAIREITGNQNENIHFDCIICPGSLRVNIKIFDQQTRKVTELNEQGVETSKNYVDQIIKKVTELSKQSKFLILSGSIPPGCSNDVYCQIIHSVRKSGSKCSILLDVNGKPLLSVFNSSQELGMPDIIKPNKDEFETLTNKKLNSIEEIKNEALKMIKKFNIKIICVSLGGDGAFITNGDISLFAPPVENIVVKGTVSAGDSLVAGLVTSIVEDLPLKNAFKRAVAAATSCVMQGASAVVSKELLEGIIDRVIIREI